MVNLPALSSQVILTQCERYYQQQLTDNNNDIDVNTSARFLPADAAAKQGVPATWPIMNLDDDNSRTMKRCDELERDNDFYPTKKR